LVEPLDLLGKQAPAGLAVLDEHIRQPVAQHEQQLATSLLLRPVMCTRACPAWGGEAQRVRAYYGCAVGGAFLLGFLLTAIRVLRTLSGTKFKPTPEMGSLS